jgi:hypothetical protein
MYLYLIFAFSLVTIYSEQLIYSNSSIVLNQNYHEDIRKKEKQSRANFKKLEKEKFKNLEQDLTLIENSPNKFIGENNQIFVNHLYQLIPTPNQKNQISINGNPFQEFSQPINLKEDGENKINQKIYSSDNQLTEKTEILHLDNFKPSLEIGLQGNFILKNSIPYFNQKVRLIVEASDIGSGISNIFVKLNEDPYIPFSHLGNKINKLGNNTLSVKVSDNVGNISKVETLKYYIDKKGPELEISTSEEIIEENEQLYCEKGSKVFLNGIDSGIGLKKILYRKNGKDWKEYKSKGFLVTKDLILEIQTEDELGNASLDKFSCKVK